jgi:hypothetical protein
MTINRTIELNNTMHKLYTTWTEFYHQTLPIWYYKNIYDKVRHYWYHESCRTCRNWTHEARLITFGLTGRCGLANDYITHESEYCPVYNLDLNENILDYTTNEDGCERIYKTICGKNIIQVSKCGIWMYRAKQEEI